MACFAFVGIAYSLSEFAWSILNILVMHGVLSWSAYTGVMSACIIFAMLAMFLYICACFDQLLCINKPYFYAEHIFRNKKFYAKTTFTAWVLLVIIHTLLIQYEKITWLYVYIMVFTCLSIGSSIVGYIFLFIKIPEYFVEKTTTSKIPKNTD